MHVELLEAMADFDDHLMEELLEGVEPPLEEIERDLCGECSHDQVVPVLVAAGSLGRRRRGARARDRKVAALARHAPQVDAEGRPIESDPAAPVVARVIKTAIHPQSGKLSIVRDSFRNHQGRRDADEHQQTRRKGAARRPLSASRQEAGGNYRRPDLERSSRSRGLESVSTGDTLTSNGHKVLLPRVPVAEPVFAVAVKPKDRIDEAKISQMLARIVDEDPALRLDRADVTHEHAAVGKRRAARCHRGRAFSAQV